MIKSQKKVVHCTLAIKKAVQKFRQITLILPTPVIYEK